MQPIEEGRPGGFKYFYEDVIVHVGHEVRHLIVGDVELVELLLQVPIQPSELFLV